MFDERFHPANPWLTKDAVRILAMLIQPNDVGVEFGSGRSTIWLAKRLHHLTSVENDLKWYKFVSNTIKNTKLCKKVDYHFCNTLNDYLNVIDQFSDGSVDFCLIDGVARDQCALKMLDKMRTGGVIVVDNVNWFIPNDLAYSPDSLQSSDGYATKTWMSFHNIVKTWRSIWTSNGVSDTAIWIKQ